MIIRFCPGKLGAKPDSLTRRWDVYPKEGDKDYAQVNPHNFRPVFTSKQLASSLRASTLAFPVLRTAVLMDVEQLHKDILSALPNDPIGSTCMSDPLDDRWTMDDSGFLHCDNHIYVPESNDLRLRVLQNTHDHPLSGHFSQNHTLELIQCEYTWPGEGTKSDCGVRNQSLDVRSTTLLVRQYVGSRCA